MLCAQLSPTCVCPPPPSYVTRSVNWLSAEVEVLMVCGGSLAVESMSPTPPLLLIALLLEMVVGAVSGKLLPVISVLSCALALSRNRSRLASERSLLDS